LYNDIPISSTSQGQTVLDTSSTEPPILQIDQQTINPTIILTGNANYDETPPVTTVQLSGTQGLNNWFKSDVTVTFNATDESGIEKTEYTLDNGVTIQVYSQPFTISQEGISKLKFRSIDKAGNEENPKEQEIKIDKTPPEAMVQFNLTTQNLEINGQEITPGEIIITDEAGNTTKLQVEPKDKKRKEKLEIKSISYNDGPTINLPDNKFEVKFKLDKKTGRLEDLDQTIKIKGEEKLKAKYNPKKDLTRIEIKEQGEEKRIEERNGIILLQLLTNKGQLETNF
ncbi:MAG: Carbohydrate binding family 6, partial [Candidatus Daviesbacteria bacterium GW2011_GWF2_38_6]